MDKHFGYFKDYTPAEAILLEAREYLKNGNIVEPLEEIGDDDIVLDGMTDEERALYTVLVSKELFLKECGDETPLDDLRGMTYLLASTANALLHINIRLRLRLYHPMAHIKFCRGFKIVRPHEEQDAKFVLKVVKKESKNKSQKSA